MLIFYICLACQLFGTLVKLMNQYISAYLILGVDLYVGCLNTMVQCQRVFVCTLDLISCTPDLMDDPLL